MDSVCALGFDRAKPAVLTDGAERIGGGAATRIDNYSAVLLNAAAWGGIVGPVLQYIGSIGSPVRRGALVAIQVERQQFLTFVSLRFSSPLPTGFSTTLCHAPSVTSAGSAASELQLTHRRVLSLVHTSQGPLCLKARKADTVATLIFSRAEST